MSSGVDEVRGEIAERTYMSKPNAMRFANVMRAAHPLREYFLGKAGDNLYVSDKKCYNNS